MLGSTRGCRYAHYLLRIEGGHVIGAPAAWCRFCRLGLLLFAELTIQPSRFLASRAQSFRQYVSIIVVFLKAGTSMCIAVCIGPCLK